MNQIKRKIPELLAPAGSPDVLRAAVCAGADAVYFGGKAFNARQGAANFSTAEIRQAVEYCCVRGVRTYLTLNTLIKQEEWEAFTRFAREVLPLGLTGLIVQDLGAADYVRAQFPNIELHASTQMSVHNLQGAEWLKEQGFSRVVLARELPLAEVQRISEQSGIETEIFIHGALCYSYSGQCLMSSMIGGRSGNRGRCAQSCRLPYRCQAEESGQYYLNLKDICTLECVRELCLSGAASLKIEGRLKGAPYVAGVTAAYRRALDYYRDTGNAYNPEEKELEELALLYNRGGFTKGYVFGKTADMICRESPKHSGIEAGKVREISTDHMSLTLTRRVLAGDTIEIRTRRMPYPSWIVREKNLKGAGQLSLPVQSGVRKGDSVRLLVSRELNQNILAALAPRRVPLRIRASLRVGEYPRLCGEALGKTVIREGTEPVRRAQTSPLLKEEVLRQLKKTGGSVFEVQSAEVEMDTDLFMPLSALNALRRDMVRKLEESLRPPVIEPAEEAYPIRPAEYQEVTRTLEAVVTTRDQLEAVLGHVDRVYLRQEFFAPQDALQYQARTGTQICLAAGYITRKEASERLEKELASWRKAGVSRVLCQHPGQIVSVREAHMMPETGPGTGVMNEACRAFFRQACSGYTASPELSAEELLSLSYDPDCACIVYGRIPVMLTEQCPAREAHLCEKKDGGSLLSLIDRVGEKWPMERHCRDCYNVFYSSRPIWLAHRPGLLRRLPAGKLRMYFLEEDAVQTAQIAVQYERSVYFNEKPPEEEIRAAVKRGCGSGHYDKGVE